MPIAIEQTLQVLKELNNVEPFKAPQTHRDGAAKSVSNWCLAIAAALQIVNWCLLLLCDVEAVVIKVKLYVMTTVIISMVLLIIAMIAPMFVSFSLLYHWKSKTYDSLCADIQHQQSLADRFVNYDPAALKDARFWLDKKIKNINSRTARFFGEKTAAISLIATTYAFVDKFGGLGWISKIIEAGFRIDNLGNTALLAIGALLFGMSLGTIFLEHLAARYKYEIGILDVAERS